MALSPALWDVTGRRVLVTGASSGLGLAMAQALAHAGARVALGGRDDDRLARALETIGAAAGEVRAVRIDVHDIATTTRAVAALDDAWGGLDALVNNAGLRQLDRSGRGKASAERRAHDDIDLVGASRTGPHNRQRFAQQGVLQAIADKAWYLALDRHGLLTNTIARRKATVLSMTQGLVAGPGTTSTRGMA